MLITSSISLTVFSSADLKEVIPALLIKQLILYSPEIFLKVLLTFARDATLHG